MSKPKTINVVRIARCTDDGELNHPYEVLDDLVAKHHDHLVEANIGIAWQYGWSEDPDGNLTLGKCNKQNDLQRAFHGHDFIIELNYDTWQEASVEHRLALLDHELCHAAIAVDEEGEPKEDEKGHPVYRKRKHDLEEFTEIVARHGIWEPALQKFARELRQKADNPLYAEGMKIGA